MKKFQKLAVVALTLFVLSVSGLAEAQEAGVSEAPGVGHRFGFGFRLSTVGSMKIKTDFPGLDDGTEEQTDYVGMASSPGFEIFWEYLFPGGILAPGAGFRVQFHNFDMGNGERFEVGSELQFDPRLRVYLAKSGWVRPYAQGTVGFSVGLPNDSLEEEAKSALGLNLGGSIGLLALPKASRVGFFVDAGIEGVFYTIVEEDQDDSAFTDGIEYSGRIRQFLLSFGLLI